LPPWNAANAIPPAAARSERVTSSQTLLLLVGLLGAGAAITQARATPLDTETCNKLMVEHETLENAGVEQSLAKGPEWAKANLSPDKIEQIRRFIELEELVQFRCRAKSRVTLPPDPEDKEKEKEKDKDKGKDKDKDKDKDKVEAKDEQDKGAPGKDASKDAPAPPKASGPAPKAKDDAKAQPKALPKKPDAPTAKAKSAAQQSPRSGATASRKAPSKAKARADAAPKATPPDDGNPFGEPFASSSK
jgi:hypothetical protein